MIQLRGRILPPSIVAETAAEALAGQQTSYSLNEYIDECGRNGTEPTQDGFYDRMIDVVANHPHRDGLVLRGNIAKVVGAAAAFAAKLDPSTAFRVAENAIENNFLFIPALVEAAAVGFAAWKAYGVLETCADAYEAYDQGGIDGLSVFIAHEGAVRFAVGKAGKAVVMVGGKAFATAKQAAQALIDRNPSLALKVADLGAITRGIELKLAHAMQDYSGGSRKMTPLLNEVHERLGGAKGVAKGGSKPGAKVNGSSGSKNIISQPEVVKTRSRSNKGIYDSHEVRGALEKKYPGAVSSTTVPKSNVRNVKLAGKRHPVSGIVFDRKGFPIFDDVTKFDTKIKKEFAQVKKERLHKAEATKNLRDQINAGKIDSSQFSEKQLKEIQKGSDRIPGLTWHHHQDMGRMQLIPLDVHQKTAHVGGMHMWVFNK